MKGKCLVILIVSVSTGCLLQAAPPDRPMTPQQWVSKMGSGGWFNFDWPPHDPPRTSRQKSRTLNQRFDLFDIKLLRHLKKNYNCHGGRVSFHPQGKMVDYKTGRIHPETLTYLHKVIDGFLELDMAICLCVEFYPKEDEGTSFTEQQLGDVYRCWEFLCKELKDKGHNLALSPVIEFHRWGDKDHDFAIQKYNEFLTEHVRILRKYNPTRIINHKGYKVSAMSEPGWGELKLPLGDKTKYYVVCGSGGQTTNKVLYKYWADWNKNEEYSNAEIIKTTENHFFAEALKYRQRTGTQFWMEHWLANFAYDLSDKAEKMRERATDGDQKNSKYRRRAKYFKTPWTLDQRIAYCTTMGELFKKHRISAAGLKEWEIVVWNFARQEPIIAAPGSKVYKVQQAYKKTLGLFE